MSLATTRIAIWSTREYRRIVSVDYVAGVLTVGFADGATAAVQVDAFRERPGTRDWDRVTYTEHEVVVPMAGGEDDEIPWDVIRSLTDDDYDRYMAERAAEWAKRNGSRVRELREGAGITRQDLAERAGLPLRRVAEIEAGTGVSLPTLERLVAAMGHGLDVFVVADGEERGR